MPTLKHRLIGAAPGRSLVIFALALGVISWFWLPKGGLDWRDDIAPGARSWRTPWAEGLPLVPWAAIAMWPLAQLPDRLATAIVNGASAVALGLVVRRLGGKDWYAIPLMLTPFGYWLMGNGQLDCLIFAGLLASRGWDAVILLTKPQVAIGTIAARISQVGSWRKRAAYLIPASVAVALSLFIWPGWPLRIAEYGKDLLDAPWNWSLWPWGLPVAMWFLWRAWVTKQEIWGILATPLLFPYVNFHTWLIAASALAILWPKFALAIWFLIWAAAGWLAVAMFAPGLITVAYTGLVVAVALGASVYFAPQLMATFRSARKRGPRRYSQNDESQ